MTSPIDVVDVPECGQWTLPSEVFTCSDNYYPQFDGPSFVSQFITLSPNGQTAVPDWADLPLVVRADFDSVVPTDQLEEVPDYVLTSLDDQWKEARLKEQQQQRARIDYHLRKAKLTREQSEARVKRRLKALRKKKKKKKKLSHRKKVEHSKRHDLHDSSKRRRRPLVTQSD